MQWILRQTNKGEKKGRKVRQRFKRNEAESTSGHHRTLPLILRKEREKEEEGTTATYATNPAVYGTQ